MSPVTAVPLPGAGGGGAETDPIAGPEIAAHEANVTDAHDLVTRLGLKAAALAATAVKTANYTAAAGDFVPVDASGGSITVTLPSAPADKTRIAVKLIAVSGANTVTIARGGSDLFNKAGGSTSLSLSLLNQSVLLQYDAGGGLWYVQASDTPVGVLDARYRALATTLVDADVSSSANIDGAKFLDASIGTRKLTDKARQPWAPSAAICETFQRRGATIASIAASKFTSGVLYAFGGMVLPGGRTTAGASIVCGSTIPSGITHFWMCLLDAATRTVQAVTADDTSAWTGLTDLPKSLNWGAGYSPSSATDVYLCFMMAASTMLTLEGIDNAARTGMAIQAPILAGSQGSGYTTPPALGATFGALTAIGQMPYGFLT
jgi:hypothetical protein